MEKAHNSGIVTVSISHYILLTKNAGRCKEAIFPFIKKNKIFIYFNPKPGLEHFTAIGVLFGPNPDYIWRDELADLLIETMKAEITQDEQGKIGTNDDGKPKLLLSLNTQTLGINKPVTTTTVALEIRVPTGQERIYTNILERLYEKSEEEEIIIPSKLGKFFPYYMKSKMQEVFTFMMRKQNAEMQDTAIIPIFGYTPSARQLQITINGEITTVELALATTKNIIRMEATPSTWNLHKYLVVVKKDNKLSVQNAIQDIFRKITNPLENQPENFPIPRCGGRESSLAPAQINDSTTIMTTYMTKLETIARAQNPQDAGPAEPPKRYRKTTISYASAVKAGILKLPSAAMRLDNNNSEINTHEQNQKTPDNTESTPNQRQVSWESTTMDTSRSMGSSLSRSVTNSKIQSFKIDIDNEIQELKTNLENRMDKQDQRIAEMIDLIHTMNKDIEDRMASAVITALVREKNKVQELTHGRIYDVAEAPLADESGRLPCGALAQSGGPLHRLHHVEVTVQHMVSVLDTIADHLQKDPSARHLFLDDDEKSETPTIIENQPTQANIREVATTQEHHDKDVAMQMIQEYGGVKRLHGTHRSPSRNKNITDSNSSSPQITPPPKRERATNSAPSAYPDDKARERGET
jgi:hypothetical protein